MIDELTKIVSAQKRVVDSQSQIIEQLFLLLSNYVNIDEIEKEVRKQGTI